MSGQNSQAANFVKLRGNRCTATTMTWLEDNVREYIPDDVWFRMRREILDNINGFKDLAIDVVKSDVAMINMEYVEHLDEIKKSLRQLRADSRRSA